VSAVLKCSLRAATAGYFQLDALFRRTVSIKIQIKTSEKRMKTPVFPAFETHRIRRQSDQMTMEI
jgi:hypothetical protein